MPRQRPLLDDLLEQVKLLIDDLKAGGLDITFPQRLNALIAIGRILVMEQNLRKVDDEPDNLGTTVRKYERAFASAYAGRSGKTNSRSKPRLVPSDDAELDSSFDTDA